MQNGRSEQWLRNYVETKCPIGSRYGRLKVIGYVLQGHAWKVKCQCDCGNEKIVKWPNRLHSHNVNSCGCLALETKIKNGQKHGRCYVLTPEEVAVNKLFRVYKFSAKHRSLRFSLTSAQVSILIHGTCNYCGAPPSNMLSNRRGQFMYNGIDRIDSSKGYEDGNVVSCCRMCQFAKRDWNVTDFLNWAERLIQHQRHLGASATGVTSVLS
jgi:hypothetical protein